MTDGPWTFQQARENCRKAALAQQAVEKMLRQQYREYAEAESKYREALAKEIVRCHNDGIAWSTAPELARGDKEVAQLRRERDIQEGMKEAVVQQAWRCAADRRDAQRFADWSQRRELAEFHGEDPQG